MTVEAESRASVRYRFGPLERRGVIAGWRGGQIAAVALSLGMGVVVLRAFSSAIGVVLALVIVGIGVAAATWPIGGRTLEEWTPAVLRHVAMSRHGHGGRRRPFAGLRLMRVDTGAPDERPRRRAAGRVNLGSMGHARSLCVGVLHDRRLRTFTAVLQASSPGFVLMSEEDKARRVEAWAGVLASLARPGSHVDHVQWVERVMTTADGQVGSTPTRSGVGPATARRSYEELLAVEGRSQSRHEVLLALSVHAGRSARAVRAAGGGDAGACALLLRELAALSRRLGDAGITVGGVLEPDALAAALQRSYTLGGTTADPVPTADPSGTGRCRLSAPPNGWPWPMGVAAEWGRLRVDDGWHATYWVAEWPRTDVGPDFLGSLLLASEPGRAVSVVMRPLAPLEAARKIERARTADIADAELRRRGGFLATARRRREEEVLSRREVELADGHAQFRFAGYVSVGASEPHELDDACGRVEQAAGRAGVELRRCYGEQLDAFMCTLPLCRGLD